MLPLFDYIKKEWAVLGAAPLAFFGLSIGFFSAGLMVGLWHYSERIEAIKEQLKRAEGIASNYRVALGIDKASKGALIALPNSELRLKALDTAAKLQALCISFRKRGDQLAAGLVASKVEEKEKIRPQMELLKEESDEFDTTTRTDASLVEIELRRRLSPQAKASIVGLPPAFRDSDGAILNLLNMFSGSGMDASFVCVLAHGIEEMAKLLPPDSK